MAVAVHVSDTEPRQARRGQIPVLGEEEPLAVAVPDGAVTLGRSDIRLPVVVEIAELEDVVTVSTEVAETALPPAVALVEVDVRSSAAAEAAGAEVQVAVPVRVREVGAEQTPLLTVGHEIVTDPRGSTSIRCRPRERPRAGHRRARDRDCR